MSKSKVMNRWIVVAGSILIQLCLGAIYAWSAFTQKLTSAPFAFTRVQTQMVFSCGLVVLPIVMILFAGKWLKESGPRIVAMSGGAILGLGYILAGSVGNNFWGIFLGVGVLGGSGIGLTYVCPISVLLKWFPDKKGMITGLAVAGFGFGALIWIKLTHGFKFGTLNLTPGWDGLFGMGWTVNQIFFLYGALFILLVGLGSLVLVDPPKDWVPPGMDDTTKKEIQKMGNEEYSSQEMIHTSQFWMLFSLFFIGTTAGFMVIGVIKLFGYDSLVMNGVSETQADVITGTAMGLFYALFNGLGRVIWGTLSDRIGRLRSIFAMNAMQGISVILFYFIAGHEWGLYLTAALIGFNFGGNFSLFPAATADFFGNKNVGTNYPWLFAATGVGGLIGPIIGGHMGDLKAWVWAFIPVGIACMFAAWMTLRLVPPRKPAVSYA